MTKSKTIKPDSKPLISDIKTVNKHVKKGLNHKQVYIPSNFQFNGWLIGTHILGHISKQNGAGSLKEHIYNLGYDYRVTGQNIERLEAAGLITRHQDRRYTITERGTTILEAFRDWLRANII